MHTLSHPNVISLTGVCLDTGGGPAVVMPFMDNGSVRPYQIITQQIETGLYAKDWLVLCLQIYHM